MVVTLDTLDNLSCAGYKAFKEGLIPHVETTIISTSISLDLDKVEKINSGCNKILHIYTCLLSCVKVCKYGTSMQYHH